MTIRDGLFTSESVAAGHPDKACDFISDTILDAFLRRDPEARVACETMLLNGRVIVAGEFSTRDEADFRAVEGEAEGLVRRALAEVGYSSAECDIDPATCKVEIRFNRQSQEIASAVDQASLEQPQIGAGDQGLMFGYATNETPSLMPAAFELATDIAVRGNLVRKLAGSPLRGDGKCQVSMGYRNGRPTYDLTAVVSWQHDPDASLPDVREFLAQQVLAPAIGEGWMLYGGRTNLQKHYLLNPAGAWTVGGPRADCGLTGRKIIVDTYGGAAPHGGGAFSGKDPTKVDRSGAYMARYLARHVVEARLARTCLVQLAYVIGQAEPVSLLVDTGGSGIVPDPILSKALREVFDLTPAGIIRELDLRRPIYAATAFGGHFGKTRDPAIHRWETNPKTRDVVDAVTTELRARTRPGAATQTPAAPPRSTTQDDLFPAAEPNPPPSPEISRPAERAREALAEVENLIAQRGLVCPKPHSWAALDQLLRVFQTSEEQRPPLPLILGAWSSTDYDKRSRLIEQLHWARDNGCLLEAAGFLLALPTFLWSRHTPEAQIDRNDDLRVSDPWWGLGLSPPEPRIPAELAAAPPLEADALAQLTLWALSFQARLLEARNLSVLDESWAEGAADIRWSQLRVSSPALADSISDAVRLKAKDLIGGVGRS